MSKPDGSAGRSGGGFTTIAAIILYRHADRSIDLAGHLVRSVAVAGAIACGIAGLSVTSASATDLPDACRTNGAALDEVAGGENGLVGTVRGLPVRLADLALAPTPGAWEGPPSAVLPSLSRPRVHPVVPEPDRYGEIRAHVEVIGPDGTPTWLQAALVVAGEAVVRPGPLASTCVSDLLALEAEARADGRGVWQTERFGPVAADAPGLSALAGGFMLVEGRILSEGETRRTVYLNFGNDYATDFTILIRKSDLEDWPPDTRDTGRLVGRQVRTRGLLEAWNGGLIRVEHPAQIELIDAPGG